MDDLVRTPLPETAPEPAADPRRRADEIYIPPGIRGTAAWGWRLLVLVAVLYVAIRVLGELTLVVLPFVAALFIAALVAPFAQWLVRRGLPRALATTITVVALVLFIAGTLTLVGNQVASGFGALADRSVEGFDEIRRWLIDLGVPPADLENIGDRITEIASENRDRLTSGALTTATIALETLAGIGLALFSLIFLTYDGERVWGWVVRLAPRRYEPTVDLAGRRAWVTLTAYVRGTLLVAFVDAFFIYVLLLILRVDLALPLAVIVFFGSFIPLVGATISATLAALVALVTQGVFVALLVVAGIIVIQQIEGHVLQPFLLGRFVRLHPLAVVLIIATGAVVAGIAGALVAVPLAAVINTVGLTLAGRYEEPAGPTRRRPAPRAPVLPPEPPAPAEPAADMTDPGRSQ